MVAGIIQQRLVNLLLYAVNKAATVDSRGGGSDSHMTRRAVMALR